MELDEVLCVLHHFVVDRGDAGLEGVDVGLDGLPLLLLLIGHAELVTVTI